MSKSVVNQYQPSFTEWFAALGAVKKSNKLRNEDNKKSDRLEFLYQIINLHYERPEKFAARDLSELKPNFARVLKKRGSELCAIRLVPKKDSLPKIRKRGWSIKKCYYQWFLKQKINPDDYIAYLCPHSEKLLWSMIFVVGSEMIFGEIIRGLHSQLTHGDTKSQPVQFIYDFKKWQWSRKDKKAQVQIKKIVGLLKIPSSTKRRELTKKLNSKFSRQYLAGYFEVTVWPNEDIKYVDYNRLLSKYITPPLSVTSSGQGAVNGIPAYAGLAQGRVVKVSPGSLNKVKFAKGSILVCDNTDVRYLPLMKKSAAIITNRGGMLSHAAIVARELKKPCIICTKIATKVLKDGDLVEVDANNGIIKKL